MPYQLVKRKEGYMVENKATGKTYEKHPIPKGRAEAQLRLLRSLKKK